jgi:phospholipid/cholesterol/gamma-HCH transport system permease protein
MGQPALTHDDDGTVTTLRATGPWTVAYANALEHLTEVVPSVQHRRHVAVDLAGIEQLDTFGAWLLERLVRGYQLHPQTSALVGVPERFRGLLAKVHDVNRKPAAAHQRAIWPIAFLEMAGRAAIGFGNDLKSFLEMLGAIAAATVGTLLTPRTLRLASAVHHLYRVGWQAIPIMMLITFLIGGIIAQQGIFHFRKFGADAYVVDMVGILVLREIGVLIVAIMVAGRSGSAYTAELGSMKMREEIDALRTMGLDPIEVLVLPRVLALILALPILTFLGSMAALYGGGLVAWLYGGMSPDIFIARVREAISVTHFQVGMIKAPFMALVIGVVACGEGLRVKGSAESLGLQTTTSVVKSIFLVIVLDGIFAIFFASIGM